MPLPREIPVRLLYDTVLFGDDGKPAARSAPYGRNENAGTALGFAPRASHPLRGGCGDVGR